MSRRDDRRAATRRRLLEVARARFGREGFEGSTIRDIAGEAGVSVGTVHAHFGHKQGLLLACFHDQIDQAVEEGFSSLPAQGPVVDQLLHLAEALYRAYAAHPALSRTMLQATLLGESPPDDGGQLVSFLGRTAGLFAAARDRGELGHLPMDGLLAAQGFFSAYLAVLLGGIGGGFGPPGPEAVPAWLTQLRALLELQLHGLLGPSTQGELS